MILCHKCNRRLEGVAKISFRATCPHCDADLHVCKNCRYFAPGKPNDCLVPGTERVIDRAAANFCEEFAPRSDTPPPTSDPNAAAKRLFGEELPKKRNPLLEDPHEL